MFQLADSVRQSEDHILIINLPLNCNFSILHCLISKAKDVHHIEMIWFKTAGSIKGRLYYDISFHTLEPMHTYNILISLFL